MLEVYVAVSTFRSVCKDPPQQKHAPPCALHLMFSNTRHSWEGRTDIDWLCLHCHPRGCEPAQQHSLYLKEETEESSSKGTKKKLCQETGNERRSHGTKRDKEK